MKAGMFMMGAFPIIGTLLILDGISGRDYGAPLIDWEEEFWRNYEVQCELEEMKKKIQPDNSPQIQARKTPGSIAQLDSQFRALEVDHELYLLKKDMGLV
ncbi:hypothetical protein H6F95_05805 [Cyanobacteria bacterium FACHB-471]|nr:hypothetical protein [Cyanobacteria bacterium FACHB-471]